MHKRTLILLTLVILGGFLIPTMPVAAASPPQDDGVIIWNEDYTLTTGAELDGDLVVFNGDATLESDSRLQGNAIIWNGSARVDGTVDGDLVVSNGNIWMGEDARVAGDVVCNWNCVARFEARSQVDGDIVKGPTLRGVPFGQWTSRGFRVQIPDPDRKPIWLSGPEQVLRWVLRIVRSIVTVLVVSAIGAVVALIWPKETARVSQTAFQSPGTSLGVGFLTLIAGLTLTVTLAITICLSPAAALIALALGAAGLFGWVAVGARIGEQLLEAVGARETEPVWSAGLGTLIITLITMGLRTAFCLSPLGWLLTGAIGCFGLGAVVVTRFGTIPYTPGRRRKLPASPPPPPPVTEEAPEPPSPPLKQEGAEPPTGNVEDETGKTV